MTCLDFLCLRDDEILRCPLKPFSPGAVINTHPWVAKLMSSQSNVTGCHTDSAGGPEGLLQVHPRLLEQFGQTFCVQLLSGGIHESIERHVDAAGEMAR